MCSVIHTYSDFFKMFRKCCVPACNSIRRDVKLHQFPSKEENKKQWLEFINCESIMHSDVNKLYVCHKHFEQRFVNAATNRLKLGAYPSLITALEISSGNPKSVSLVTDVEKTKSVGHNDYKKRHSDHSYTLPIKLRPNKLSNTEEQESTEVQEEAFDNYMLPATVQTATMDSIPSLDVADAKMTSSRLCSCCLELCAIKTIWEEYNWSGRTEVYGDMLKECFDITWARHRPRDSICEVCVTQLRNAVRFRQQVLGCQAELEARGMDAVSNVSYEKVQEEVLLIADDGVQHDDNNKMDTAKRKLDVKPVPSKRHSIYRRRRLNACLMLEHSTLLPFKSNKGYFNCFYCNKQYVSFEELKSHVQKSHAIINFDTIAKSILRPNDKVCVDASNIVCKLCDSDVLNIKDLIQHLTVKHRVKFIDSVNTEDSVLPFDLGDGKFRCYECKSEFTFFKTLSQHMNEHSADNVCSVCGRCFLLAGRLRAHSQMHTNKTCKCEMCGKICSSDLSLNSHIRYAHKKLSYLCLLCDKKFDNNRLRLEHLQLIHNRAPLNLNCKFCSKKFMRINSLNTHVRRDHLMKVKEAKHGCSDCGMMFKSKYNLSNHSLVHSGEKNFECEVCHKRYARVRSLREHLKIHLNDKRWCCSACDRCFVQKCSLKNHIRVHHANCDVNELIVYKKPEEK